MLSMANDDLVKFFHTQREKATLNQILKFTSKSFASIYSSIVRWRQRGYIRVIRGRRRDDRRIYELTESGRKYIAYKSRQNRENSNKKRESNFKKIETRY